jgi:hypothetical protein
MSEREQLIAQHLAEIDRLIKLTSICRLLTVFASSI